MTAIKRVKRVLAATAALCLIVPAMSSNAHHSTSEFAGTEMIDIEGVVTKKFWRNPHVTFRIEVSRDGVDEVWTVEGASVSNQKRRGIGADVINVGDTVTIAGFASTRRDNFIGMRHVLLANGTEISMQRDGSRRWPELAQANVGPAGPSAEAIAAAEASADGLFRVWSWGRLEPGWWFFGDPDAFPLTDAALSKFASWDEYTDNPQLDCVAPGMPLTMGNPYPIEFFRVDEKTIVMKAHEFDVTRTIHLDATPDRSAPETNMGYSVGRWENDQTLIVETVNINYPYFNRVGISSGPDLETKERFVVDSEAGKLHYFLTVKDPWALTEPFEKEMLWTWNPGVELGRYGCEVEE